MMAMEILPTTDETPPAASVSDTEKPNADLTDTESTPGKKGKKEKPPPKKRVRNEMNHKTKLRKLLRNSGQEYVTKKGKIIKAKSFENKDCGCSKKCPSKIPEEQRQKCFDKFWNMSNFSKQNAYLSGLVTREAVKQHRPRQNVKNRGPKGVTYQYRITVGRISRQVCKVYFLDTFVVSNGRLARALRKEENEREPGEDLRGKKVPANKTSEENMKRVKDHINSFPKYDMSYCPSSKGRFLMSDLNVKKMYSMYLEECKSKNATFVKENIYRTVFNDQFSLTFLHPRKDPCILMRSNGPKTPRKKKPCQKMIIPTGPENSTSIESSESTIQMRCNLTPQIFCPTENAKCSYNSQMQINQDKETMYTPACQGMLSGGPQFYHQDQAHSISPHFHNHQQPSFFNL